jgi:hypothetical protein
MTKVIRITDLSDPQYTPQEVVALHEAEHRTVKLTVDAVLAAAEEETGLADFGAGDFRERLGLMLEEVDQHPYNTAFGRLDLFDQMARYASNRLRIQHLLQLHPEIVDVEIKRPIWITGMPRTGTTDLVNTMAADRRLRTTPSWETRQPVPNDPEQRLASGVDDPRLLSLRRQTEAATGILPYGELMHSTHPEYIEEDSDLKRSDFTWWGLQWEREVPRWRDYWFALDKTSTYAYLKTVLKILQWYRPGERMLLKAVEHMAALGPLMQHFPDATIVFMHRDPVAVVQSSATMAAYSARMHYTHIDSAWYLDFFKDMAHRHLKAYFRDRHLVPKGQVVDLFFDQVRRDQMGSIERIYEIAGLPITISARAEINSQLSSRARGFVPMERGKVVYDLRADYGVEPADIRSEFDYYVNALAVQPEVI